MDCVGKSMECRMLLFSMDDIYLHTHIINIKIEYIIIQITCSKNNILPTT